MSKVWHYFIVDSNDNTKAKCTLCELNILRGKTPKTFSTKPLWNHLKSTHKSQHKVIYAGKEDKDEDIDMESEVAREDLHSEDFNPRAATGFQPTLEQVLASKQPMKPQSVQAKKITRVIGEMIAVDAEPYLVVERPGFKKLMATLAPNYIIPSRKHFAEKVIPEVYADLKSKVETFLQNAQHLSFTTDIWTNSTNQAFISFTAHYIDPEKMDQNVLTLSTKHFPDAHTAMNISLVLSEILEEWTIEESKVHMIIHDNAANMIAGQDSIFFCTLY